MKSVLDMWMVWFRGHDRTQHAKCSVSMWNLYENKTHFLNASLCSHYCTQWTTLSCFTEQAHGRELFISTKMHIDICLDILTDALIASRFRNKFTKTFICMYRNLLSLSKFRRNYLLNADKLKLGSLNSWPKINARLHIDINTDSYLRQDVATQ